MDILKFNFGRGEVSGETEPVGLGKVWDVGVCIVKHSKSSRCTEPEPVKTLIRLYVHVRLRGESSLSPPLRLTLSSGFLTPLYAPVSLSLMDIFPSLARSRRSNTQ